MDTSETYVKMCIYFELQQQWKPKEGDYFSFIGDIHILSDYEVWALEKKELSDIDCWNEVITLMGGHFVDHWNECREGFVWLPRQDQIQEMLDYGLGALVNDFQEFCEDDLKMYSSVEPLFGNYRSMEQLWLAFYMHEKHGKIWDGEKWGKK